MAKGPDTDQAANLLRAINRQSGKDQRDRNDGRTHAKEAAGDVVILHQIDPEKGKKDINRDIAEKRNHISGQKVRILDRCPNRTCSRCHHTLWRAATTCIFRDMQDHEHHQQVKGIHARGKIERPGHVKGRMNGRVGEKAAHQRADDPANIDRNRDQAKIAHLGFRAADIRCNRLGDGHIALAQARHEPADQNQRKIGISHPIGRHKIAKGRSQKRRHQNRTTTKLVRHPTKPRRADKLPDGIKRHGDTQKHRAVFRRHRWIKKPQFGFQKHRAENRIRQAEPGKTEQHGQKDRSHGFGFLGHGANTPWTFFGGSGLWKSWVAAMSHLRAVRHNVRQGRARSGGHHQHAILPRPEDRPDCHRKYQSHCCEAPRRNGGR